MLLSDRRTFLLGGLGLLAGCGFSPVYGPQGSATKLQNNILLDEPKSRPAYLFVREFETRMGRGTSGKYGLSYSISLSYDAVAIDKNDVTNRLNLVGTTTYALRDLSDGAVLKTGHVTNFTGFSNTGTTVASQAASRDAEKRLMIIMSDQVITQLIAAAPNLPE
ncbi:LPS assembly lipoprotein LptE [Roseovarius sp. EL26]|uniref:LPS assembly lipoprotein LptE n=1 Tax=Roseovarius sp. EL26 TaxID=2126672 RepID=UPI000EA31B2F|nr:LPS assembly lipoprotein LptE [Roseovarius sp. EL26]